MSEEKEYISLYVTKPLAEKLKDLKEGGEDNAVIGYINEAKRDMKINIESIGEDVLIFKDQMATAKKEFLSAKDEHIKSTYELWEKFDEEMPRTRDEIKKIVSTLTPLKKELDKINNLMKEISLWKAKSFAEDLETIKNILQNKELTEMIRFLIKDKK